jgi:hypothetical protein
LMSHGRAWAAEQAALLRRLAAGEDVRDRVDWTKLFAEIEKIGQDDNLLSAEEEAEIRRRTRRVAAEVRISGEEWDRARGSRCWPILRAVSNAEGAVRII